MKQEGFRFSIKRILDASIASAVMLATSPIMAAASIAIVATDGLPILFRQARPGLHEKPFELLKFRTMKKDAGKEGFPQYDAERLTRVGKLLRDLSIDELPQLWNVIRGDMSLVGPRPLLMRYLPRYTKTQARRHDVLPGISGWAQVNGRNAVTWDKKFELDVWYVDHWSPWLDLKILAKTFVRVVRPAGVSSGGHVTMPEFMGTNTTNGTHAGRLS